MIRKLLFLLAPFFLNAQGLRAILPEIQPILPQIQNLEFA